MKKFSKVFLSLALVLAMTIPMLTMTGCDFFNGSNEDYKDKRIPKSENPLYYATTAVRIMGNVIGKDKLIAQRNNDTNTFEEEFNNFTNNNFEKFVDHINEITRLENKKTESELDENEIKQLQKYKDQLKSFLDKSVEIKTQQNANFSQMVYNDLYPHRNEENESIELVKQ